MTNRPPDPPTCNAIDPDSGDRCTHPHMHRRNGMSTPHYCMDTDRRWTKNTPPIRQRTGVEIIAEERQRQIDGEGFSSDRDDGYTKGEMALAASAYAIPPKKRIMVQKAEFFSDQTSTTPSGWPWSEEWWKPGDRIRELAKAGALIAGEIDRLNRANECNDD